MKIGLFLPNLKKDFNPPTFLKVAKTKKQYSKNIIG